MFQGHRANLFRRAVEEFRARGGRRVVEIGSIRDQNSADGDGHSTLVWSAAAAEVYSIDCNPVASALTRRMAAGGNVTAMTMDGLDFLRAFRQPIDLLYLDGPDPTASGSHAFHRQCFEAAAGQLHPDSLVLIDDTFPGGKGEEVIPAAVATGWEVVLAEYMTLLARPPKTLVLIPTKRNMAHRLLLDSLAAEDAMRAACGSAVQVVRDFRGPGDAGVRSLADRVAHTCQVRQALIQDHLKPDHTHVVWIDADVIRYDARLPLLLCRVAPGSVVGPKVLLDGHGEQWYDVAGFVEDGQWARHSPPFFRQTGDLIDLDGVGCVYAVPAEVYRAGARHAPVPGYTDHLAVCRFAKSMGRRVVCDMRQAAYHADLPLYGEAHH